jgi:hypothetical protein
MATPKNRKYLVLEAGKNAVKDSQGDDVIFTSVQVGGSASGAVISYDGAKFQFAGKSIAIGNGVDAGDAVTLGQLTDAIATTGSAAATTAGAGLQKIGTEFSIDLAANPGLELVAGTVNVAGAPVVTDLMAFGNYVAYDLANHRVYATSNNPAQKAAFRALGTPGQVITFVVASDDQSLDGSYQWTATVIANEEAAGGYEDRLMLSAPLSGTEVPSSFNTNTGLAFWRISAPGASSSSTVDGGLKVLAGSNIVVNAGGVNLDPAFVAAQASALSDAITAEAGQRSDADDQIRTDFAAADTAISATLATETADRAAADTAIRTDFAAADAAIAASVTAEAGLRTAADAQLRTDFAAADTAISATLATETADRVAADTAIRTEFAAADTAIAASVTAEAAARDAADTAIRTDFAAADAAITAVTTAEAVSRIAADDLIRTDFAAADTQVRTDFAAADAALLAQVTANAIIAGSGLQKSGNTLSIDLMDNSGLQLTDTTAGTAGGTTTSDLKAVGFAFRFGSGNGLAYFDFQDMVPPQVAGSIPWAVPGASVSFTAAHGTLGMSSYTFTATVQSADYDGESGGIHVQLSNLAGAVPPNFTSGGVAEASVSSGSAGTPPVDGGLKIKAGSNIVVDSNGVNLDYSYVAGVTNAIGAETDARSVSEAQIRSDLATAAGAGLAKSGNTFSIDLAAVNSGLEIQADADEVLGSSGSSSDLKAVGFAFRFGSGNGGAYFDFQDMVPPQVAGSIPWAVPGSSVTFTAEHGSLGMSSYTFTATVQSADYDGESGGIHVQLSNLAGAVPPSFTSANVGAATANYGGGGASAPSTDGGLRVKLKASGSIISTVDGLSFDPASIRGEFAAADTVNSQALAAYVATNNTRSAALEQSDIDINERIEAVTAGFDPKESVNFTLADGANFAGTYLNGNAGVGATLTATGDVAGLETAAIDDRVLLRSQANAPENGIFRVTGLAPIVLTRAEDFDGSPAAEITRGARTLVSDGVMKGYSYFVVNDTTGLVVGTTPILWSLASGPLGDATKGVKGAVQIGYDSPFAIANGVLDLNVGDGLTIASIADGNEIRLVSTIRSEVAAGQTVQPRSLVIISADGLSAATAANATDDTYATLVAGSEQAAVAAGAQATVLVRTGAILTDYLTGMEAGKKVYVHNSIPGQYTQDPESITAGNNLYQIGRAVADNVLILDPRHLAVV